MCVIILALNGLVFQMWLNAYYCIYKLACSHGLGCCSEEIGKSKFNSMIGLVDRERVDAELYDDYETDKAREVCLLSL